MKYYSSHEFFEEGRKEGYNTIILKMLSMNQPIEFISQCTGCPVDYIRQVAQENAVLLQEDTSYHISQD